MNQKTAKRIHKFAKMRETDPKRAEQFYKNAKAKYKRANIVGRTLLNSMLKRELEIV